MMTHRERVLNTLRFQPVDRAPYDLMEGAVWGELQAYFRDTHGLNTPAEVIDYLDTDFRWIGLRYTGPQAQPPEQPSNVAIEQVFSGRYAGGALADAQSVSDVLRYPWPDPNYWQPEDYAAARAQWPQHALVFGHSWMPLFWTACEAFGMEEALIKMHLQPDVFEAFIAGQHEMYLDILTRALAAAQGVCDICWLGDDYASQQAMLFAPERWRTLIKPYLAQHVALARAHGLFVLFHSCGNVRAILPDLIEIGVNGLLVFQTTANEMDAQSIARDFGGDMAFYGGIDVQHLLSHGTPDEVTAAVRHNVQAFTPCGGYIVANSHHGVSTIQGRNIEAMCQAAREGIAG